MKRTVLLPVTIQLLWTLCWERILVDASVLIIQDNFIPGFHKTDIINTGLKGLASNDVKGTEKNTQIFRGVTDDRHEDTFNGMMTHINRQNSFYRFFIQDDYILIGSRNILFNVSLISFKENMRITWQPALDDIDLCLQRQKTGAECQNYIRVIERKSDDELMICGTNAFRPLCRTYRELERGLVLKEEESGTARCPYDPQHNSTAVIYEMMSGTSLQHQKNSSNKSAIACRKSSYDAEKEVRKLCQSQESIGINGRLYAATVADLSGRDSLIYSRPLRTEQHDSQWLNEPDFMSSFGHRDRVYFFFRETAVENINCGKAVFSRVARVCTSDTGGSRVLRNTWTTFSKARLNCSIPGDYPFYFDELQSTTDLGVGNVLPTLVRKNGIEMIYAVFTTPRNSLRGSAVCAFRMSDIVESFEGAYKEQRTALSNWLPVKESSVPEPHPGLSCPNGTHTLSDQTLNFIKSHPLMDRAVPAFGGQPIIVQASFNFSFTQIAVDWQIYAADRRYYDIIFIGTDEGKVYKVINKGYGKNMETVVIEILTVFEDGSPVTELQVYRDEQYNQAKLIVGSANEIRSLPLARCHLKPTCSDCMAMRDPYCSWIDNKCADSFYGIQSIDTGRHAQCPTDKTSSAHTSSTTQASTTTTITTSCPPCAVNKIEQNGAQTNTTNKPAQDDLKYSSTVKSANNKNTKTDDSSDVASPRTGAASSHDSHRSSPELYTFIIIICIILSLIVGFIGGFFVAVRYYLPQHAATYRVMNKDCEVTFNAPPSAMMSSGVTASTFSGKSIENEYEPEPMISNQNRWPQDGGKKQTNVFINELKSRTNDRANNVEISLHKNNLNRGASDV